MKIKILILLCNLSVLSNSFAQQAISSLYATGNNCEYILGEPISSTIGANATLTQGFLQGIIEVVPSGIESTIINNSNWGLYPNPIKTQLNIAYKGNDDITNVTFDIFNTAGKLIYHIKINQPLQTLDLSHIPSGLYFVRISSCDNNNTLYESKIIKH